MSPPELAPYAHPTPCYVLTTLRPRHTESGRAVGGPWVRRPCRGMSQKVLLLVGELAAGTGCWGRGCPTCRGPRYSAHTGPGVPVRPPHPSRGSTGCHNLLSGSCDLHPGSKGRVWAWLPAQAAGVPMGPLVWAGPAAEPGWASSAPAAR